MIAKPVIYITLAEIVDTHQLLLDHKFQVAPGKIFFLSGECFSLTMYNGRNNTNCTDEDDPLHELLSDLGGDPSLCSLLGAAKASQTANSSSISSSSSLAHLAQTEVCLTLSSKFAVPASLSERVSADRVFVKTKHLLACVLPCTSESNLLGCLKSAVCQPQVELYWRLVDRRQETDQITENNKTVMNSTNLFADDDAPLPLEDCKRQILKNLQLLERHGYVSKRDGFQAIITSLGRDIVNQKLYRTRRRRDIFRLKATMQSLEKKRKFYEDQVSLFI